MDPATIIALLNGALQLGGALLPQIDKMRQEGTITPEQQAEIHAKYLSLKSAADGQFSGPQWQQSS